MTAYFKQNRFDRRAQQFGRRPGTRPEVLRTTDEGAVTSSNARGWREYIHVNPEPDRGNLQKAALWGLDVYRSQRFGDIRSEVESQIPRNHEVFLDVTSPGGVGGTESVEVFNVGQNPSAVRDPYSASSRRYLTIRGTAPEGPMPESVTYTNTSGQQQSVTVQGTPPKPQPKKPNAIDSEPRGIDIRFDRRIDLPASARGDRGHPSHGRMTA